MPKSVGPNWLENKISLLVTNNNTDRSGWRKILKDAGADQSKIHTADSFNTAKEVLENNSVDIVFCQYQLEESRGIELYKLYQKLHPLKSNSIFIFVTEVTSKTITAICGDYEVDGLIQKPYNLLDLEKSFAKIIEEKMKISPMQKMIDLLEATNANGDFNKVIELSSVVQVNLDSDKALHHSSLAYAYWKTEDHFNAQENFKEALRLSPLNHKALVRYFTFLMEKKSYAEAYEIARSITHNFPVNPERIPDYMRVALATKNYETVVNFCETLSEVKDFDEAYLRPIGAGLALASKYLLQSGERKPAYKAAKKALDLGVKQRSILATAMTTLIDLDQVDPVEKIIESIPSDEMDEDLLVVELKYLDKKENAGAVFQKGIELTSKNIHAMEIYEILIRRSKELNRSHEQIDDLIFNATKFNPNYKKHFESMK